MLPIVASLAGCQGVEPWSVPYVHTVVPWVRDSTGAWFLLDTGTPRTQLRTDVLDLPPGDHRAPEWSAADIPSKQDVFVSDALPALLLAAEARGEISGLGGILGVDRLAEEAFWLDPRAARAAFVEPLPGSSPVATLDAEVTGSGETTLEDGTPVSWDRGRMLVQIALDGEPLTALVDTAATYVMLAPAAASRIGAATSAYAFEDDAPALEIGFATVDAAEIAADDVPFLVASADMEEALIRLTVEVDRPVEAVLGHSFLRRYVTGLDFRGEVLELRAYDDGDWSFTSHRVSPGAGLTDGEGCFVVRWVIEGSPADEAGLALGDCVTRVDGWTPGEVAAADVAASVAEAGPGTVFDWEWDGLATPLQSQRW